MIKSRISLILLCLLTALAFLPAKTYAQAVGTWTSYLSYNEISHIEAAGKYTFVVANSGLYCYNSHDGSVSVYDRSTGLSDTNIKFIRWNQKSQRLVIAYGNSNIDILNPVTGEVIGMPDLYMKSLPYGKTINSITSYGQEAFLATGFGVVRIDVARNVFVDSYILGFNVNNCCIVNNGVAISAKDAVYFCALDNMPNNPASWKKIVDDVYHDHCFNVNGELILTTSGWFRKYDFAKAEAITIPHYDYTWIDDYEGGCIFGKGNTFWTYTNAPTASQPYTLSGLTPLSVAKGTQDDTFWAANADNKLALFTFNPDGQVVSQTTGVSPDGPVSNHFWRMAIHDGKLYAPSGRWRYSDYLDRPFELHILDGDRWSTLERPSSDVVKHNIMDANCIAFDPKDGNHFFVGTRCGLYEYSDGKFVKEYSIHNSGLENYSAAIPEEWTMITSLVFDEDGNLWVMNNYTETPIKCLTASGEWRTYPHPSITASTKYGRDIQKAFISKTNGCMWFTNTSWSNSALYKYDYHNDKLTDYKEFVNEDGTSLQTAIFYGTTEDKNGNVWVASSLGPLYMSAEDIRSGNTVFTQHKVPRNDGTNYADYLLNEIATSVIVVDAANRKWIGTESSGLYLISDDCNTELAHFTTDNSQLLSNSILDIVVDDKSGMVYIATTEGLCSYMSDAIDTGEGMLKDNVWAYPNPVTPDYTGVVNVRGLEQGSTVRITTVSGELVNEGSCTANGYQWDTCDLSGQRVASGVYMVHVATKEGKSGIVTKIAVVR